MSASQLSLMAFFLCFVMINGQSTQTLSPVSQCLNNCTACLPTTPATCAPLLIGGYVLNCIPFYTSDTANCGSAEAGVTTILNQLGSVESAVSDWSVTTSATCTVKTGEKDLSISGLGPFTDLTKIKKNINLNSRYRAEEIIVKLTVAVNDSQLVNSQPKSQTQLPNGTIMISPSTATQLFSLSVVFQDNSLVGVGSFSLTYQAASIVQTSCGYAYQYQMKLKVKTTATSISMQISKDLRITTLLWTVIGLQVQVGCSGFLVSIGAATCNQCLSGYFSDTSPDGHAMSCPLCDSRCLTCTSRTQCSTCQPYTTRNSNTGMCEYSSSFVNTTQVDFSQGSQTISSVLLNNPIMSSSGIVSFKAALPSLGGYLFTFYLLFTQDFSKAAPTLKITDKTNTLTLTQFPLLTSTYIEARQAKMYLMAVRWDNLQTTSVSSLQISMSSSLANNEFLVSNVCIIQYQCVRNCLSCPFQPMQVSACTKCAPFFSLSSSCLTCALGFFRQHGTGSVPNTDSCVRCYSNCQSCNSPSMFSCLSCYNNFQLANAKFQNACINCLFLANWPNNSGKTCDTECKMVDALGTIRNNPNCVSCLSGDSSQLLYSPACIACWSANKLAEGRCAPMPESQYILFLTDISNGLTNTAQWTSVNKLSSFTCQSNSLYGLQTMKESKNPSNINLTLTNLPKHEGLQIIVTIFKIDLGYSDPNFGPTSKPMNATISVLSPNFTAPVTTFQIAPTYGSNICSGPQNEVIFVFNGAYPTHNSTQQLIVRFGFPQTGLMLQQLEVYLGNCPSCPNSGLLYTLTYMPAYSKDTSLQGINVFAQFNQPISLIGSVTSDLLNSVYSSMQFAIDDVNETVPLTSQYMGMRQVEVQLMYFVNFTNKKFNNTLTSNLTSGGQIIGSDVNGLPFLSSSGTQKPVSSTALSATPSGVQANQRLNSLSASVSVPRYSPITDDQGISLGQLQGFFSFVTWFTLLVVIIMSGLGIGVLFEQFSQMMQLIALHAFFVAWLLPSSVSVPLQVCKRMIPLQVFTDQQITDIRSSISGTNYPSNYVLHQFGWDYYFLGNFWAIIIYNAIFLIFFLVLFAINYSSERFRQADNFVFRFLRRIPQRPLNYFDGLCRVQFITTIWCGLLQFQYYSTNVSIASISLETQVINLIITMVAFVGSTVWPFFVMIYTWNRHKHLNLNHFHYLYDDIFYRRISSLADEVQSYLYIGIRFGRLFLYTILVALLMRQPIVGPVLLIFANVLEGIIVFVLQVYRNNILMGFKLFENTLFVVTAVLVLIFTNFSTSSSISDSDYFNVGYGIIVCFVLMIINAFIRFTYLIYDKCKADNSFVLGEQAETPDPENLGRSQLPSSMRKI